jgi:hypothetical protein
MLNLRDLTVNSTAVVIVKSIIQFLRLLHLGLPTLRLLQLVPYPVADVEPSCTFWQRHQQWGLHLEQPLTGGLDVFKQERTSNPTIFAA